MSSEYYCDTMQSQLTGIKARAYDMVRGLENSSKKDELAPQIKEIHSLLEDMRLQGIRISFKKAASAAELHIH